MRKPFMTAAFLVASVAGQAAATQWDVTTDKGLVVHRLTADTIRLTVVCDPEGAFTPPQNYLFVEQSGQRVEAGELAVSGGDSAVSLPIEGAAALPTGNVESWNTAMNLLFGGGLLTLAVGELSAEAETEHQTNSCTAR